WQKIHLERSSEAIEAALNKQNARPSLPPQLDAGFIDDLPDGPGVYLFYGENNLPIYVGKAKEIRKRVLAHFSGDLRSAKEMALVQQVRRIDWIVTAGEIGALLKESALVKELLPTQNRQLRKNEEVCTWTLVDEGEGWLRPQLVLANELDFGLATSCYGLFKNSKEANTVLRQLIESHSLCDMLTGQQPIKPGKPCFGHQIRRCKGACLGKEPLAKHTMRLMTALTGLKLVSWPFPGPAILREDDEAHVIDGWRYLGTVKSDHDIHPLLDARRPQFDRDTYKILAKYVARMKPLAAIRGAFA
ncbi:MAG TPA: ethanolamine utilization protein, partial [Azonexus sp.]|nr:ethanolamine utilization protein [Azonexus sp.]